MYSKTQRALAEVLGTAALVLVGPGSVIATLVLAAMGAGTVPPVVCTTLTVKPGAVA